MLPNRRVEAIAMDEVNFVFETVMRVRSTEVSIGQHMTIEALIALLSETRARFLYSKDIKEITTDYTGLVINDVSARFVSRVRAREELLFEVGVHGLHDSGGDFVFKVSRMFDGSAVAQAVMGFVAYDYRTNQPTKLSPQLVEVFDIKPFVL